MTYKFNKGHIVPRWCGVKATDRKAQHTITFGCDVKISRTNDCVSVEALSCGSVIMIRNVRRKMKNGTTKKSPIVIHDLNIVDALSAVSAS